MPNGTTRIHQHNLHQRFYDLGILAIPYNQYKPQWRHILNNLLCSITKHCIRGRKLRSRSYFFNHLFVT